ncbi:hypothetical protein KY46_15620 [Photobacterium halotolerans]|uniref:Secreted protein n=1 Tax=Photobacterium halotolerans TaxID=265726 RepID=A0A0F5VBX7_9GAMM|nr:hypothetical protein KY46_15620 [Photobacterium halotolerans]
MSNSSLVVLIQCIYVAFAASEVASGAALNCKPRIVLLSTRRDQIIHADYKISSRRVSALRQLAQIKLQYQR